MSDQTICFCHAVTENELIEAIRSGAKTMTEVQVETCASTGCGGCYYDVEAILDRELKIC
jgi:NAD(P)H-nitrite reductase large subunit